MINITDYVAYACAVRLAQNRGYNDHTTYMEEVERIYNDLVEYNLKRKKIINTSPETSNSN